MAIKFVYVKPTQVSKNDRKRFFDLMMALNFDTRKSLLKDMDKEVLNLHLNYTYCAFKALKRKCQELKNMGK